MPKLKRHHPNSTPGQYGKNGESVNYQKLIRSQSRITLLTLGELPLNCVTNKSFDCYPEKRFGSSRPRLDSVLNKEVNFIVNLLRCSATEGTSLSY